MKSKRQGQAEANLCTTEKGKVRPGYSNGGEACYLSLANSERSSYSR